MVIETHQPPARHDNALVIGVHQAARCPLHHMQYILGEAGGTNAEPTVLDSIEPLRM